MFFWFEKKSPKANQNIYFNYAIMLLKEVLIMHSPKEVKAIKKPIPVKARQVRSKTIVKTIEGN